MDQLVYDPLTKQQIKNGLMALLYEPIEDRLNRQVEELIVRNTLLGGYRHKSFVYRGKLYNADDEPPPIRQNKLLPQLRPELDKIAAEASKVCDEEMPYVLGFINQVLNSSNSLADYLQLFPEAVHEPIQKLIGSRPHYQGQLQPETIQSIKHKSARGIELMKQRLTLNLLL